MAASFHIRSFWFMNWETNRSSKFCIFCNTQLLGLICYKEQTRLQQNLMLWVKKKSYMRHFQHLVVLWVQFWCPYLRILLKIGLSFYQKLCENDDLSSELVRTASWFKYNLRIEIGWYFQCMKFDFSLKFYTLVAPTMELFYGNAKVSMNPSLVLRCPGSQHGGNPVAC